ncbi:hypothetical protein NBRC116583_17070 [Arenicella sp. 4NH20-0111]|uniref:hypothetical protein n=1 Tax=Arenicella sp. 4NH20-0111 TaxID=3127648 RepID=UPI003109F904
MSIWEILAIEPTDDLKKIKRAYSSKLKVHRPDSDPAGYQTLREAFDEAKRLVKQGLVDLPLSGNSELEMLNETESDSPPMLDVVEDVQPRTEIESEGESESDGDDMLVSEINEREDENPDVAHSKMSDRVFALVQEIHELVRDGKEIEGVALFREHLKLDELVPVDYSKGYELQVLEYLNWWCEKRVEDAESWLPLGFMRQLINHYQWHTSSLNALSKYPALEQLYDTIHQNSGLGLLQRVRDKQVDANQFEVSSSDRLLGPYRPTFFAFISVSSARKMATFNLLNRIEEMNDSSFDFELNTETVKWWLDARQRFLFEIWMLLVGLFFGAALLGFITDVLEAKAEVSTALLNPLVTAGLYAVCVAVSSYLVFKLFQLIYYLRVLLTKKISRYSGALQELIVGAVCMVIVVAAEIVRIDAPYLASVTGFVSVFVLTYFYRYRAFWMFAACLFMYGGFQMDREENSTSPVNLEFIVPVLLANTLLFWGYLDFKAKQRERKYQIEDMSAEMVSGVCFLVVLTTFAYSLIAL